MKLLSDMTNTQVVEKIRAGDDMVFTRLYEDSYRMVYFQAFKILGQADEAELVAQDVFITVFRRIDELKEPESLRAWIIGIAVRLAMNRRRKLSSSHEFALEDEAMFVLLDSGGASDSPEDTLSEQETGLILGELLDQLPEEQRTAVLLYYYDEYSIKEIASVMGCAEGTVKSRLNYARKALEKSITQREQREGIRLHAFDPSMIILAIFLQEKNMAVDPTAMERGLAAVKGALGLAAAAGGAGAAAAGTTAAGAAVAGTTAAGAAAAGATAAGTGGSAMLFGGLSVKVAACVLAGAVAVGGVTVGFVAVDRGKNAAEPTPAAIYAELPTATPEETAAIPTPLPVEETEEPAPPEESEPPEEEPVEAPPEESEPPTEPEEAEQPEESPAVEASSEDFAVENGVLTGYSGPGGAVVIPDGVTAIGDWVFFGNGSLTSLTIPEGVSTIGVGAFQGCTNLSSVTFPYTLRSIGTNAFSGTGLTALVIPDSVTTIGDGVFQSCTALVSVSIGGGVSSMGSGNFYRCTGLRSVSLADSMSTLGISTFSGCTGLTEIRLPSGVTKLDYEVFAGCTGLTGIVIPASVSAIGYRAFAGCSNLADVTIPESVTSVDATAFEGTAWLAAQSGE
ncbi:MAG: sigma-70 family RNA polymerase sigma factor [Oscillospiraceae bacterium]